MEWVKVDEFDFNQNLVFFGDYLHIGLRKIRQRLVMQTSARGEKRYHEAISLKEGEKRNLRDAIHNSEEASGSSHTKGQKNWWSAISMGDDERKMLSKQQSLETQNWSLNWRGNGEGRESERKHETLLNGIRSGWSRGDNQIGSYLRERRDCHKGHRRIR